MVRVIQEWSVDGRKTDSRTRGAPFVLFSSVPVSACVHAYCTALPLLWHLNRGFHSQRLACPGDVPLHRRGHRYQALLRVEVRSAAPKGLISKSIIASAARYATIRHESQVYSWVGLCHVVGSAVKLLSGSAGFGFLHGNTTRTSVVPSSLSIDANDTQQ